MIDGVTKVGHYARCGHSRREELPFKPVFFGAAEEMLAQRFLDGQLNLACCMAPLLAEPGGVGPAGHDSPDSGDETHTCHASLSCSRPDSQPTKGICDMHGIVGSVCAHTIPVIGGFMDLRTPENFSYYLVFLDWMVIFGGELRDVYIDFGCRLSKTWARCALHELKKACLFMSGQQAPSHLCRNALMAAPMLPLPFLLRFLLSALVSEQSRHL